MTSPDTLLQKIRTSVIGDDRVIEGPFGPRRITYADYTASGRALTFIEDFLRDQVLPYYANTHTESSGTGLQTTRLREDARTIIHDAVGNLAKAPLTAVIPGDALYDALKAYILTERKDQFRRAVAAKAFAYALGRYLDFRDRPALDLKSFERFHATHGGHRSKAITNRQRSSTCRAGAPAHKRALDTGDPGVDGFVNLGPG